MFAVFNACINPYLYGVLRGDKLHNETIFLTFWEENFQFLKKLVKKYSTAVIHAPGYYSFNIKREVRTICCGHTTDLAPNRQQLSLTISLHRSLLVLQICSFLRQPPKCAHDIDIR
jgi:hypothetical protein